MGNSIRILKVFKFNEGAFLKIQAILLTSILLIPSAFAESLKCSNLKACIGRYSKMTKETYVIAKDVKGKDFELIIEGDLKNIDFSLSFLLNQHGYTRVKHPENGLTMIIPTRDIRYNATPLIDSQNINSIPKNYDYFMLKHKLKNKFLGKDITRSLRPFMSRYGRIIINQTPGIITLQDTGLNIHRLLELINTYDIELSEKELKAVKKKHQSDRKHQRRLELIRAKKKS